MAWVAPVVGAAGSLIGGSLAGRKSPEEKASQANLLESQRRMLEAGGALQEPASEFTGMAKAGFQPALDYWTRILAANRPEMMSALAPEVGRIVAGYTGAAKQVRTFGPAGGGRASLLASLPFQQARDISTLFSSLRPQAATILPQIGSAAGGIGTNLYNQMLNAYRGVAGGAGTGLEYDLARQRQTHAIGSDIGRSIFDIVKMIPLGGKGGTRGGTGYGTSYFEGG